jgi:pyruvate/2-oxoglutarate dehydrogenase complex dihydrolipoamide acyltransferase (E2) component
VGGVSKVVVPDEGKGCCIVLLIADETKFLVKNAMQITLSCDHRVMDGVMGANFLNTIKK